MLLAMNVKIYSRLEGPLDVTDIEHKTVEGTSEHEADTEIEYEIPVVVSIDDNAFC